MAHTIFTTENLANVLKEAKAGGQFVTIYGETPIKLNKYPTDGSERVKINDDFNPTKRFHVTFNFAEDYEKTMAKALGVDNYDASDYNREHIVHNILMRYISTDNVCLIYLPKFYQNDGTFLNGKTITKEQEEYMLRYKPNHNSNAVVEYRTIGVKNVTKISIGKNIYNICIGKQPNVNVTIIEAEKEKQAEAKR